MNTSIPVRVRSRRSELTEQLSQLFLPPGLSRRRLRQPD
jgi:hypothetical protein